MSEPLQRDVASSATSSNTLTYSSVQVMPSKWVGSSFSWPANAGNGRMR